MTSKPTQPPFDLAYLLNQASYALAARMGDALSELGLTVSQYCVMWKAGERERSQVEISQDAAMDKSSVVTAVDHLENVGLATRRVPDSDRRARIVGLTNQGAQALRDAHLAISAVYDEALSDLTDQDRQAFVEALTTVTGGVLAIPSHVTSLRRRRSPRPR